MWNHAPLMRQSREQNGVKFERLSSRDVADIAEYASRGQAKTSMPATLPDTRQGAALFQANCAGCHPAIVDLKKRLKDHTPTEVAASLWNHANSMLKVPMAAPNDMRNLVGYVWNQQFQNKGDAVRGAKSFREKGCESCHQQMNRGERIYSEYTLISTLWVHGPLMQADIARKQPRWPKLAPEDVENLVAFMNSKK
jgi:cytochrome c2